MKKIPIVAMLLAAAVLAWIPQASAQSIPPSRNVVIFVTDGLRARSVNDETAPNLAALARQGVTFVNSHSLFPTFTMANASAISTGHYLGDTGIFSNTLYVGFPVPNAPGRTPTPFIENDAVLGDLDAHFNGNFINEDTVVSLARQKGYSTAIVGKVGPTLLFDHTQRDGTQTIVFDDSTGSDGGIPLSPEITARLQALGLPAVTPKRGANGEAGSATKPGTRVANVVQQDYLAAVATRAVLPLFAERGKPFVLLFWSRDPDATQHNEGDSFLSLVPGINGPAVRAAIRNADDDLGRIRAALAQLGLADNTDIVVTADHGFATIGKESVSSAAAQGRYPDVPPGLLPQGFLALDLAKALNLPLIDQDDGFKPVQEGAHPRGGNGMIGGDAEHPKIVVAANGGSDLIYIPDQDRELAGRIVAALVKQDYVSGIFVNGALGTFPGALSLVDIWLQGSAATPVPSMVVNFRSFDTVCGEPVRCPVVISDTALQQGQGMHGSFSRAETWNFMAMAGPDFKPGFVDTAPSSNADVGRTIGALLHLGFHDKGALTGRVLTEAMPGGVMPDVKGWAVASEPAENGVRTMLEIQAVGATRYFDVAGFSGRTLGLSAQPPAATGR